MNAAAQKRRSWTRDPAGRRARILAAATQEFGANGYDAARMDRVAARADVAEGTVYHQFGSKRGLLAAVGEHYGAALVRAAFGDMPAELTPDDAERVIGSIFDFVRSTHAQFGAFVLANEPGAAGAARTATRDQMVRALETRLARWSRAGSVSELDARTGAALVYAVTESALRECFLHGGGRERARWARETTRMIRRYLASGSGASGSGASDSPRT